MDILNIIIGMFHAFINWLSNIIFGKVTSKPTTTTPNPTTTTPNPTTTTPNPTTTTSKPTTTTPNPTTTTPEPTTTPPKPTTTTPPKPTTTIVDPIATMDLSQGIAKMDLSQGIANMNLFQTFGTTTPPPTQKPIIDAIKSSLTLKNDGNGTNYTLNGVYDGKDVALIDKNRINDYLLDKPKYVYKINEIVEFTFTITDQDYKIKLRIINSSLEYGANLVSSVKFIATTELELPVLPSVYTVLKLKNDGNGKDNTLNGTYDGKDITLTDNNHINDYLLAKPKYVYKPNEIIEFTFTNPISKQDDKVKLRIISSSLEYGTNLVSSVKFMATTAIEIPVAPSVYTSLKLNDGIIKSANDGMSKQYTLSGTYDGKSVTLVDKKNIAYFNNPQYEYKVNEIAEFTFTNPISNQDSKVNLKITKSNMTFDSNFNMKYTFNSILSPPVSENYIGIF